MSVLKMAARFVHVFNDKTVERKRDNITFWLDTEIGNKEGVLAGRVGSRSR